MSIAQTLLPEYDAEMANTRKALALVPDDKFAWRAKPKMNTLGWVANHLAEIPSWVEGGLHHASFDMAPPGGPAYQSPNLATTREVLALFDANVAAGRAALAAASDAVFGEPWSLLQGGQVLMTMPKFAVIRTWVLNHTIHHRAFLCAYLRLNDIAVPGMYGPGDEAAS